MHQLTCGPPPPFFFAIELPENWTDTRETIVEGMTFNLGHLGMTLVDEPKGAELSAAAVKRIIATVRGKIILNYSAQMNLQYSFFPSVGGMHRLYTILRYLIHLNISSRICVYSSLITTQHFKMFASSLTAQYRSLFYFCLGFNIRR